MTYVMTETGAIYVQRTDSFVNFQALGIIRSMSFNILQAANARLDYLKVG